MFLLYDMSFPLGFFKEKYSPQGAQEDIYCIAATAKKLLFLPYCCFYRPGMALLSINSDMPVKTWMPNFIFILLISSLGHKLKFDLVLHTYRCISDTVPRILDDYVKKKKKKFLLMFHNNGSNYLALYLLYPHLTRILSEI